MSSTFNLYSIHLRKQITINYIYLLLLMLILSLSYVLFVVPVYGYMGFYVNIKYFNIIEVLVLLFGSFTIVWRQKQLFSGQLLGLLYVFIVPSTLCYYILTDQPRIYIYCIVGGFILTVFTMQFTHRLITENMSLIRRSISYSIFRTLLPLLTAYGYLFYVLISIVTLLVFSSLYYYNGLPTLIALDIFRVYEIRGTVIYGSTVISYLVTWQTNVINPVLITIGIQKRNPILFLVGGCFQFIIYLYTGHKAVLFAIPLIIITYLLISKRNILLGLIKTFFVVVLSTLILYLFFGHQQLPSLFIRRVFFVPPQVRSGYFDYFTQYPHFKMSGTSLEFLWASPYDQHLAVVIGDYYLDGAYANVGYLSSAFADFGVLGVIVFAVLAGIFFAHIEIIVSKIPIEFLVGLWIVPVFNLDASRLSTTLMTHGLLFAALLSIILYELHQEN